VAASFVLHAIALQSKRQWLVNKCSFEVLQMSEEVQMTNNKWPITINFVSVSTETWTAVRVCAILVVGHFWQRIMRNDCKAKSRLTTWSCLWTWFACCFYRTWPQRQLLPGTIRSLCRQSCGRDSSTKGTVLCHTLCPSLLEVRWCWEPERVHDLWNLN
jgi:hypothetical protein